MKAFPAWNVVWVAVGVTAFMAPQIALFVSVPPPSPPINAPGWFLNSGFNVATIAGVITVVAALLPLRRRWRVRETATFGAGVLLAMIGTLVAIGPGTIFPIVIVIGSVVVGFGIFWGTAAGCGVRRLTDMRMAPPNAGA
jgi:hypothetical protein